MDHRNSGRFNCITLAMVMLLSTVFAFGQLIDGVDPTFTASPASDSAVAVESAMAVPEPNGKTITLVRYPDQTGGTASAVNRINADGSIDNSFNCTTCTWPILSIARQPSGKVLVAGNDGTQAGNARIWRLNADGSLDSAFVSPYDQTPSFSSSIEICAVAPDGKIYAARRYSGFHVSSKILQRLNVNGSIDTTFTSSSYDMWNTNFRLTRLAILPDGKLLITGKHGQYGKLFRLNNDGTKDTSLDAPALGITPGPNTPPQITDPTASAGVVQPEGKVVFTGLFDSVNALPRTSLARLNADGSVDPVVSDLPFAGAVDADIRGQSDGKMIVLGGSIAGVPFRRINADLTVDDTYSCDVTFAEVKFWTLDSSDRVVYFGNGTFHRLNTNGSTDLNFNFGLRRPGTVSALAAQLDGKILIAGNFEFMSNVARAGFARVNPDGSNDPAFDPGTGFDVAPHTLLLQPDGKILAYGTFTTYNGIPRNAIARINADGTLDSSFAPSVFGSDVIALQPDGKVLLGGGNMTVNGFSRTGLARLNADGTTDAAFNPLIGASFMAAVMPQADGKIAFAGGFSGVNGFSRSNFARLNSDGSLDPAFNAGSIPVPTKGLQLPDGRYLLAADAAIIRRNADGSADNSFVSQGFGGGSLNSMISDSLGRIMLGGNFTSPRSKIARLNANGALDTSFLTAGANAQVRSMVRQPDNNIVVGGDFTSIAGVLCPGVARLTLVPAVRPTRFDFDGDGRADISFTQPGDFTWRQILSFGSVLRTQQFGLPGDKVTPADYDGDGKTDIGVFDPPSGWWFKSSLDGQTYAVPFGQSADIPMPGDIDGNGKADFVVVRNYAWYAVNINGQMILAINFGQAGDKPITGDFDGDGKTDPAVYRPSTGEFIYAASANNGIHTVIRWGAAGDTPVPADYDGDGKTDAAVYRPSDGVWWVLFSRNLRYRGVPFGLGTDKPVPADYDGDGMADIAVFRPSDGNWYFLRTAEGYMGVNFGTSNDIPTAGAFIPPAASLYEPPKSAMITKRR